MLDALAKAVAFMALKENIRVEGKRNIQTKVMTTLFALFAEVERDLISERTREGLARARSSGRTRGKLDVSFDPGPGVLRLLLAWCARTRCEQLLLASRESTATTRGVYFPCWTVDQLAVLEVRLKLPVVCIQQTGSTD